MKNPSVYNLQNAAIHEARRQLEDAGLFNPGSSLEAVRAIAAEIGGGVASISKLLIEQRRALIERLIEMGARVKNPTFYDSDLKAEAARSGRKKKVLKLPTISENQRRLVDTLAARISWSYPDGLNRLCRKLFDASEPRNNREITHLRAVLESMIEQQKAGDQLLTGQSGSEMTWTEWAKPTLCKG